MRRAKVPLISEMRHTHNASKIPLRRRVVQGRRALVAESAPQPCHRSGRHTRRQRGELSWRRVVLLQLHLFLGHRRWRSVTESGPDFGHPRFGCLTPRQRTSVRFLPRSRGRRRRRSTPGGWSNLTTHSHSSRQKVARTPHPPRLPPHYAPTYLRNPRLPAQQQTRPRARPAEHLHSIPLIHLHKLFSRSS